MKPNPHALVSALLLASLVLPAQAFEQGWVSWVIDGDTVVLVPQGQRESVKLRIAGIDAPEACQTGAIAWFRNAQASTSANTGSTFMIAELPTTPSRGSTVNMRVKAVP